MFKSLIRRRVAEVMNQRIKDAEDKHKVECERIEKKAEDEKQGVLDTLVDKIIGNK